MIGSFAITGIRMFSPYVPSSLRVFLPPHTAYPLPSVRDPNSRPPKIDLTPPLIPGTFTTDDQLDNSISQPGVKNVWGPWMLFYPPTSDWLCPNRPGRGAAGSGGQMSHSLVKTI